MGCAGAGQGLETTRGNRSYVGGTYCHGSGRLYPENELVAGKGRWPHASGVGCDTFSSSYFVLVKGK